jgi:hypothetical protein
MGNYYGIDQENLFHAFLILRHLGDCQGESHIITFSLSSLFLIDWAE